MKARVIMFVCIQFILLICLGCQKRLPSNWASFNLQEALNGNRKDKFQLEGAAVFAGKFWFYSATDAVVLVSSDLREFSVFPCDRISRGRYAGEQYFTERSGNLYRLVYIDGVSDKTALCVSGDGLKWKVLSVVDGGLRQHCFGKDALYYVVGARGEYQVYVYDYGRDVRSLFSSSTPLREPMAVGCVGGVVFVSNKEGRQWITYDRKTQKIVTSEASVELPHRMALESEVGVYFAGYGLTVLDRSGAARVVNVLDSVKVNSVNEIGRDVYGITETDCFKIDSENSTVVSILNPEIKTGLKAGLRQLLFNGRVACLLNPEFPQWALVAGMPRK